MTLFRRTVGIAIAVVAGVVALLGVSLVAAQEGADPSATRSFDTASVASGGTVTVTIAAANYGSFGRVTETLPDGFSYVSSDLDDDEVSEDGQSVKFTLQGADITFTYTVTASDTAGTHDFSGTLRDDDRDDHDVGGPASVTVTAGSATSGASASRSFDTASVAPGGTVTVTIAAANYGSFGRVTETLPDEFSYVSSDLDDDEVSEDGQSVKFTLQGADITFTYTVTASDTAGTHDFSGTLRDDDRDDHDVGGPASVTVTAGSATSGASASRSFDTASVAPGGTVTVTIAAANYGSFGRVTETLPDEFSYVSSDLDDDEVSEDGQSVKFTLQGADITFTYTVTASDTAGTHDFSGTLRDSDRDDHDVVGAASVTVLGPRATRSFSPMSVRPSGRVTVTITALDYGRFGRVTETLPGGFSYVSSDLDDDEVSEDGQTVKFTLQGTDITFTYTVTAPATAGTHNFSGMLRDSDRDDHDVGGNNSVRVSTPATGGGGSSGGGGGSSGSGSGSGGGGGGQSVDPTSTPTPRPTSTPTPVPTPTPDGHGHACAHGHVSPDAHANAEACAHGDDGSDGHANDGPSAYGYDGSNSHGYDGSNSHGYDGSGGYADDGSGGPCGHVYPSAYGDDGSHGHANSRAQCYRGRRRRVASVGEHRAHHRGLGFGRGRWPILLQIEDAIGVGTPEIVKDRGLV